MFYAPSDISRDSVDNWVRTVQVVSGEAERHYDVDAQDVGFDNPAFEHEKDTAVEVHMSQTQDSQSDDLTLDFAQSDVGSVVEASPEPLGELKLDMLPSLTKDRARGPAKRPPSRKRNPDINVTKEVAADSSQSEQSGPRVVTTAPEGVVALKVIRESDRLQTRSYDGGIVNLAFVDDEGEGSDPKPLNHTSDTLVPQQEQEHMAASKDKPESSPVTRGICGYDNPAFDPSGEDIDVEIEVCVQERVKEQLLHSPMLEDEIEVLEEVTVVASDNVFDNILEHGEMLI